MDCKVYTPNNSIYNLFADVNSQMFSSNMRTTIRTKKFTSHNFFLQNKHII